MTVSRILVALNILNLFNPIFSCDGNRTVVEASGNATVVAFVDTTYGPDCNIASLKGFEQVATALRVIETLNEHNYVPGIKLGLNVRGTCKDNATVYKESLTIAAEQDCAPNHELGLLIPQSYRDTLKPLEKFELIPITTYDEPDLTELLIKVMINFLSTKYETIDLFLSTAVTVLENFVDASREAGMCLKSYANFSQLNDNATRSIVALAGNRKDIQGWIEGGGGTTGRVRTWILLPLDGSNVDDLLPAGSYVVKTELFDHKFLEGFPTAESLPETAVRSVLHSPHILGIGKAIIEVATSFRELSRKTCPYNENEKCVLPRFDRNSSFASPPDIYAALKIPSRYQFLDYIVAKKYTRDSVERVASYKVNPVSGTVNPHHQSRKMAKLCGKNMSAKLCEECSNFHRRFNNDQVSRGGLQVETRILKSSVLVPILLTIIASGTLACGIIVVFIVYRYVVEEILDGNPALTICLVLSTMFMLQSVVPFCLDEESVGSEYLNSRKILVTTLSIGFVFSIMLGRSLFLAFSVGGIFTTHINGYLQSFMVFFIVSVQVTISTMFFYMNVEESRMIIRSKTFLALLGYDIFLLFKLFVASCFIAHIRRNYREGRCFFGTVIGLVVTWAVWLTSFILVEPEHRDNVVSFGVIASAYLIILGILIPRTYYMMNQLRNDKVLSSRYIHDDGVLDQRQNGTLHQPPYIQSRQLLYDHTFPASASGIFNPGIAYHPNYYGCPSPNSKFLGRARSPDGRQRPGYNNYAFNSEMREVQNSNVVPRICVENTDERRSPVGRTSSELCADQAVYLGKPRMVLEDEDCTETDIYVEDKLTPSRRGPNEPYPSRCSSPRLGQTETTIREEDEERLTRITRF